MATTTVDVSALIHAVVTLNAEDAFRPRLTPLQWRLLGDYLTRHEVRAGELLIRQGERDRIAYLLEQGSLQVYATRSTTAGQRIAILRPGALVGEPALFGDVPRTANVEAMTHCVVWALHGPRMEELAARQPALAIELLRNAGVVLATRLRAHMERAIPTA
jgi:CRP-like cAMP-binding protein